MKTKTPEWTAEEDTQLAQAVVDKVSAERLCVRLHRSVGSIKRRMRDLGLAGKRRGPHYFEAQVLVSAWLEACHAGALVKLLSHYDHDATLECACSGPAIYAGVSSIQEYWSPKLQSDYPHRFLLERLHLDGERIVVDYLNYEGKSVRMFLTLNEDGKISSSKCAPRSCSKIVA